MPWRDDEMVLILELAKEMEEKKQAEEEIKVDEVEMEGTKELEESK